MFKCFRRRSEYCNRYTLNKISSYVVYCREPFLPFNDARNHLNNRSVELRHRHEKKRSRRDLAEPARSRNFPPTNGERSIDSYERELREFGYSQRDRRSGRSESPNNKNSDVESNCSDKSEHSSSRRFLRHFTRSPSDPAEDRGTVLFQRLSLFQNINRVKLNSLLWYHFHF